MPTVNDILRKPVDELDEDDEQKLEDVTAKPGLDETMKKPVEDMDEKDDKKVDEAKAKLPPNVIVLPYEESSVTTLPNTEPVMYTVKKGDTLKKISEMYSVSYGELCNHLMDKNGSTMIYEGMEIQIPRHFIDLSHT